MNKTKIKITDLSLIFGDKKKEARKMAKNGASKSEILEKTGCTIAVDKATLQIDTGEIFVIMGLSGSGKSTLLRCINRLINPTEGSILVNEQDITRLSDKELLNIRRKEFSMVFQKFALLPHRTILENTAFGLELQGIPKEDRNAKAQKSLDGVGLKGYENMFPEELSGGMQQRVGLARALANDPEVLLMDEAFSALDPLIRAQMQDELLELQEKMHKTIVFITHDLDEAIKLGDRIAIMKDGKIVQVGTAEEILRAPADDYVASFVEKVDRKNIITASSLMFDKPTIINIKRDGPKGALRKMRATGLRFLPVVGDYKNFRGFVFLEDVIACVKDEAKSLEDSLKEDVATAFPGYTVEEMLPLITDTRLPVPVVDEESNKLLGIIEQTSLIIEATGFEEKEMQEHIQKAIEQ